MKSLYLMLTLMLFSQVYAELPEYLLNDEYKICKNNIPACSHYNKSLNKSDEHLLNSALDSNLDVLNYDLFLDWTSVLSGADTLLENKIYHGIQKITFQLLNQSKSIKLNAVNLVIDSISVLNNTIVDYSLNNGELTIVFQNNLQMLKPYSVIIYYHNSDEIDNGFYLYPKGKVKFGNNEYYNYEKLAATFSEPELARYWMPCNDIPNDKAFAKISVKVPEGYVAVSNGILEDTLIEQGVNSNNITFVWNDKKHKITTYLMAATASKFAVLKDEYKSEATGKTIPILNYVWKEDSVGNFDKGDQYDAISSLKNTSKMIKAFSKFFVEYPFDKYGHVILQPFYFGGMEHQTISSINRIWLQGKSELGIAHELGHQWLGDLITAKSWQDIWINEGGASWCEALWVYASNLDKGEAEAMKMYNKYFTDRAWQYLSETRLFDKVLNATPTSLIFDYTNLSYTKASWVYNMLFRRLGTDFLEFMRYLFNTYKNNNISSKEFELELVNYLNQNHINFDASEYFNQIVYSSGHPSYYIFLISQYQSNDKFYYKLNIQQVQEGNGFKDIYNYHIKVDCYKNGNIDTSFVVFNNSRNQEYQVVLNNSIDSINIDKSYTLCNVWTNIVSVKESNTEFKSIKISPNPIYSGQNAQIEIPNTNSPIQIKIIDMIGNVVYQDYVNQIDNSILYTLNSNKLVTGTYIVCLNTDKEVFAKKMIIIKN